MQTLTRRVHDLSPPGGLFDEAVLRVLFADLRVGARRALVHRATRRGEVHRVKAGLYCLDEAFRHSHTHPFALAAMLHWPSHISLEAALAHHGMIPEAVLGVSSVTARRSREYRTVLGHYSYTRVPSNDPMAGVRALKLGRGEWAFVATPLRAIADLFYLRKREINAGRGLEFLTDSMRVDHEDLAALDCSDLAEVVSALRSRKARHLLTDLVERIES